MCYLLFVQTSGVIVTHVSINIRRISCY
uniref:Uncharacterized protein n=1 Tax=Arundo donax TaxID=35708 RepID=A0A0A9C2N1_ARUDO